MTAEPRTDDAAAARWLRAHEAGASVVDALAFFDRLPAMPAAQMLGVWRGSGLPTGSPLDGLLEAYGWYGKQFLDDEAVHPLLFSTPGGPRPVDPAMIPLGLLRDRAGLAHSRPLRAAFSGVRPFMYTGKPKARLRELEHRNVVTAAMIYDALPIIDVFRQVDLDTVVGLMDMRGLTAPFFFVLRRD